MCNGHFPTGIIASARSGVGCTADFIWRRDEGALREGRRRGAALIGGIVPIATTSRRKPLSEFKSIDF
jgi:hypothetical protein